MSVKRHAAASVSVRYDCTCSIVPDQGVSGALVRSVRLVLDAWKESISYRSG